MDKANVVGLVTRYRPIGSNSGRVLWRGYSASYEMMVEYDPELLTDRARTMVETTFGALPFTTLLVDDDLVSTLHRRVRACSLIEAAGLLATTDEQRERYLEVAHSYTLAYADTSASCDASMQVLSVVAPLAQEADLFDATSFLTVWRPGQAWGFVPPPMHQSCGWTMWSRTRRRSRGRSGCAA